MIEIYYPKASLDMKISYLLICFESTFNFIIVLKVPLTFIYDLLTKELWIYSLFDC